MSLLIFGNFYQVLVERIREAGIKEILVGEVGKTLAIEGVLEVLKRQSIVENGNIIVPSTSSDKWMRGSGSCKQNNDKEGLHSESTALRDQRVYAVRCRP